MTVAFHRLGFNPHFLDYQEGLAIQRRVHESVRSGLEPPTVLLCEHSPVYTAGGRTEEHELPLDGTPVVPVDRGGKLTWHGPGQLVGYPLVPLPYRQAIRPYVHLLEETLILSLAHYSVKAERVAGRAGIWLTDSGPVRKIGAIGIRVHHGVTMHGFALNCTNDVGPFRRIVPCGISDASVTSLHRETGIPVSPQEFAEQVQAHLRRTLPEFINSPTPPIKDGQTTRGVAR